MFKQRFLRLNAALLEELLKSAVEQLHNLIPGPPTIGLPIMFFNEEGEISMASIEVVDTSAPLLAKVKFFDAEGYETVADDVPVWSSSDESVASVVASSDGLSAEVSIGGPGVSLVEVKTVEANTGAEVGAQGTITVTAGDSVVGEVSFELAPAPEPTPEPAPEPEPTP